MSLAETQTAQFVRFMTHVSVGHGRGECWAWSGNRPDGRYGHFSINGAIVKAHRWMYQFLNGPIPEGLVVRHRCDNPACVNPQHLDIGTPAQNAADMVERGRNDNRKGERHPLAQVSASAVLMIRREAANGRTQSAIAKEFGISRQQVGKIIRRDNWGHI